MKLCQLFTILRRSITFLRSTERRAAWRGIFGPDQVLAASKIHLRIIARFILCVCRKEYKSCHRNKRGTPKSASSCEVGDPFAEATADLVPTFQG